VRYRRHISIAAIAAVVAIGSAGLTAVPASAAGEFDKYLLSSGSNASGQLNPITIPEGQTIKKTSLGSTSTWVLTNVGTVLTTVTPRGSNPVVPVPPTGVSYTDIAASGANALLLRSDGTIVFAGRNASSFPALPAAPAGATYSKVFGGAVAVALRSDGRAVLFRYFDDTGDNVPATFVTRTTSDADYVSATSGTGFVLLTHANGRVKGVNMKDPAAADARVNPVAMTVPKLPKGTTYVNVGSNATSSIFIRSDGVVKVTGDQSITAGIPRIPTGTRYTDVSVGTNHAAFVLSNGDGVVSGIDPSGAGTLARPEILKGNRFTDVEVGGNATVFTAQKLTPNVKVQTTITRTNLPTSVTKGKTATIRVKVYSMARTLGGTVKITYKNKVIGTGIVADGAIAIVKVKTSAMKKAGANKIGISFTGLGNAKKSLSNTRVVLNLLTK